MKYMEKLKQEAAGDEIKTKFQFFRLRRCDVSEKICYLCGIKQRTS